MTKSVARGTILGIGGQIWHMATAFLLYAFLARRLGPEGFGEWKLALSLLNWFELFVNAGLVKVATKAIAERPADRPQVVRGAYLGQAVLAAALLVVALVAAGPIASSLRDPNVAYLLRIASIDIPLYAAFMVAAAVLLGVERFERHALGMTIYASAKLVAIGALVWFGFSVEGALVGNALASIVGFVVVFTPWPRPAPARSESVAEAKRMGPASVPFLAQNLLEGLGTSVDLWSVKRAVGSSSAVGFYGSAATLAEVPAFLFVGLNRALFPSIARVQAEGDTALVKRYTTQAVRLAVLVTIFGAALVASTGEAALTLVYSKSFVAAYPPLLVLMLAASSRTVWSVCTEVLMASDRRRRAIAIVTGVIAVEIALLAVLTPRFATLGAATSVLIASTGGAIAGAWAIRSSLSPRLMFSTLRSAVAAALVGGALWFASPTPAGLFIAYPVAAVAYALLLLAMREVDRDDIDSIAEALGKRRRR